MQRFEQDPKDPEFVQNPYAFYDQTRPSGPAFVWADYNDLICLTGHADVSKALRDKRLGREAPTGFGPEIPDALQPFYDIEAHSMLEREPPVHTRLRGLVLRAFTSRRIKALGPDIEALCVKLLKEAGTEFDLLESYAKPIPAIIIARLLGVPEEDWRQLLVWSNAMVCMYMANRTKQMEKDAVTASLEFADYIHGQIHQKRNAPDDDLLSALIAAEQDGSKLSNNEMVSTAILLLNAGHEATVHSMGNITKALIEAEEHTVTDAVIEEGLRIDPPLHLFTRWVYEDIEIAGQSLKRGDQIACLLAAANHDPTVYPDPSKFAPSRKGPAHVSFGAGIHFCVGAPLARLELVIALKHLFDRHPKLSFAEAPRYADLFHFHGLESLRVQTG